MSCRFNAVLFDLDGTLIDTAPDFIRIIHELCQEEGIPPPSAAAIRTQVSEGARAMVQLIKPHAEEAALMQYRQHFLDRYEQQIAVETTLFAGMDEILLQLEQQGVPWGIVTNKPRYLATALLAALQLDRRCAVLVCPEDVTHRKPDPEPMYLAASQLNLPAEHVVYIGDHPRDIEAGRAAQMTTVIAAYGYLPPGTADQLDRWQADHIVADVPALSRYLLEN